LRGLQDCADGLPSRKGHRSYHRPHLLRKRADKFFIGEVCTAFLANEERKREELELLLDERLNCFYALIGSGHRGLTSEIGGGLHAQHQQATAIRGPSALD
jgi:hypothetical protein